MAKDAPSSPTPKGRQVKKSLVVPPPFLLVSEDGRQNSNDVTNKQTHPSAMSESLSFNEVFEGVSRLLNGRKNVVVLVGAGMSTSCGIPDFRSKDHGLYAKLDVDAMGLSSPEELFCYDFFQHNPAPFFQFARNLYFPLGPNKRAQPSDSHKLLALLEENKMLLRVYSQNIDELEAVAGVSNNKIVYAHGTLGRAQCMRCGKKVVSEGILPDIQRGTIPRCQVMRKRSTSSTSTSTSNKSSLGADESSSKSLEESSPPTMREPSQRNAARKRPRNTASSGSLAVDDITVSDLNDNSEEVEGVNARLVCGGILKPAVTFFGETLNDNVRRKIEADRTKADALIVIGTSLSVAPISKVIRYLSPNIPRILINRTIVEPSDTSFTSDENDQKDETPDFRRGYVFDAYLLGYCDDVARALARNLLRNKIETALSAIRTMDNNKKTKRQKTSDAVSNSTPNLFCGSLLSNVLRGKEESWNAKEWLDVTVPPERVLLFPGALPSNDDVSCGVTYREVAHCDGCSKRIEGIIQKCANCFDFDLCAKCFPSVSKNHFSGSHSFNAEVATKYHGS